MSNVKLIPHEWNTKKLALKSKAVSTLSGTIGIEAAIYNKPVLAFEIHGIWAVKVYLTLKTQMIVNWQ